MLSPKTTEAEVLHGDTLVVPITVSKRTTSPAAWTAFRVCVSRHSSEHVDTISFQVRAQPFSAFRAKANSMEIDPLNDRTIITKIKIKNNGNVYGRYYVSLVNEALRLDNHPNIVLKPGQDTLYSCVYKVPAAAWKTFNTGDLHLTVTDSLFIKRQMPTSRAARQAMTSSSFSHNPYYETIPFAREDSVISEHVSAFPLLKIALEAGYISYNGTSTYFAAIKGTLPVGNDSRLRFDYRSREYGLYNILDHDVYNIYFDSPHWRLHAGQVNDSKYFRTYGIGLSATYSWGGSTNNVISVFGVRHTPGFNTNNDNAGLTLKLLLGNINWLQAAYYNTDSGMKLNSYLYTTELSLANSSKLNMLINGGIGLVENMLQSNVHGHDRTGYYLGYKGSYKDGNWTLNSCATYYDEKFPGYNQGSKNTLQSIRYSGKKGGVEAYYQYDVRQSNYFVDTVYNTDILTYNVQKYGLRFYVHSRQSSVTIGGGVIRQVGLSSYSFAPDYTFGELQYNYTSRKGLSVSLSSLTGYAAIGGVPGFLVSAYGTVAYRAVGISGGYSRIPVVVTEAGNQHIAQNVETIYGGPYVGFSMFRHLSVSTQYSVSKTLYGDGLNSFANINLTYENPRIGTRISMSASAPLQRPDATSLDPIKYGYLNISFRKDLGIPFILKRKYYNLKARFFRDENGNGVMDDGEAALSLLPVQIGDKHLITDRFGFVHYKNIAKGNYDLDLSNSPVKGYIPGDGYLQPVSVVHNKQVDIPFRMGKVVSGRIKILQDSAYEGTFSPGNLKVTGRDSAGHEYSAITNSEGDYFLSLPAGRYNISLNPAAFNDFYKPSYFSRDVDISTAENKVVDFDVKQRRRGVKMLQVNGEVKAAAAKNLPKVGYVPATIAEKDSLLKAELKNNRHHRGSTANKTSANAVDKKMTAHTSAPSSRIKTQAPTKKALPDATAHTNNNAQQTVIDHAKQPAENTVPPKVLKVKRRLPAKKQSPAHPNPPRLICSALSALQRAY